MYYTKPEINFQAYMAIIDRLLLVLFRRVLCTILSLKIKPTQILNYSSFTYLKNKWLIG